MFGLMQDRFSEHQSVSMSWYNKATDLRGAAGAVWAGMGDEDSQRIVSELGLGPSYRMAAAVGPVFRMLCGMSIELLLKAVCVERRRAPEAIHNLGRLASLSGVDFDADELPLLDILSEAIVWHGRYPTPKKRDHWDRHLELSNEHLFDKKPLGSTHVLQPNHALDWEGYTSLWNRVHNAYWDATEG